MAHNYLRHRIGGAGFYEEISSDSDEYEENDELDPVEEENAAELGVNFDDDFLEDDGVPGHLFRIKISKRLKSYGCGRGRKSCALSSAEGPLSIYTKNIIQA